MSDGDREVLTVFSVRQKPMTVTEVASLLEDLPEEKVSTLPPVRPKAGEIYIYRPNKETEKGKWIHLY